METINFLLGYKNYKIVQNTQMFNFSLDSVLLPNFVTINKKIDNILDIGCGNAPIPLILTTRTPAKIIGIEIQAESYLLAKKTIDINNLSNQIEIIKADVNEFYLTLESDSFDTIVCNPPFFKVLEDSKLNNNDCKTIARHEVMLNLKQIFKISKKLLKNNGNVAIVNRPERLVEIIEAMKENNIEPKKLQFVYPKIGSNSNCVLIEGTKNGKPGIKILDPIFVHDEAGNYSEQINQYFK